MLEDNEVAIWVTFLIHFEYYIYVHSSAYLQSVVKSITLFLATSDACCLVERVEIKIDEFAWFSVNNVK